MANSDSDSERPSSPGRRSHVALLFSDVSDYSNLSERVEPEIIAQLKRQLSQYAIAAVTKHAGKIVQFYGDGILAVFGFDELLEDTSRRALNAALDLHELVRNGRWKFELPRDFSVRMHSGVHVGVVFGRAGDKLHGTYDLAGDAVNTAARLSALAGRDEIMASTLALGSIEEFFACDPPVEATLKGKQKTLSVRRVRGRTEVRTRFEARARRGLTTFVGRSDELLQLSGSFDEPSDRPRVTLVTGVAGVGKTRLLEELRLRLAQQSVRVLSGSCDNYSELVPLQPFIQILEQIVGEHGSAKPDERASLVKKRLLRLAASLNNHLSTFLRALGLPASEAAMGSADERSALLAWTCLFETLGTEAQTFVTLDDWQWADDASRALLAGLVENSPSLGAFRFVIGTRGYDPSDYRIRADRVIELRPLDELESRSIVRELRPLDGNEQLAQSLYQRSGGNPLFLEELCRSISSERWSDAETNWTAVPVTVQDLIQVRVARLPSDQKMVLRNASVVGLEFTIQHLCDLAPQLPIRPCVESLVREGLIYQSSGPDTYRFKHGITRDVIYETILLDERRALHASVAQLLEHVAATSSRDESEALAHHYVCSANHAQAAHHSEIAANKALLQGSLDRARFHYAAAMSALEQFPQEAWVRSRWLEISFRWALPCAYSPSAEHVKVMERALALACEAGDEHSQAQACHWLGWFHFVRGNYAASIAAYTQALQLARHAGNDKLIAQLYTSLGQAHGAAGEHKDSLQWFGEGLALKSTQGRALSRSRALGYAHALACNALVHADRGDFDIVERLISESLEIVSGSGHPMEASVLSQSCMALLRRGDWKRALDCSVRSIQVAERTNTTFSIVIGSFFRGCASWILSRDTGALAEMQRACSWLERKGQALYISFNYATLADALRESGDFEQARLYAQRALERAGNRDVLGDAAAHRVLAQLDWHSQDAQRKDAARRAILLAFDASAARGSRRERALTNLVLAELSESSGEEETALRLATDAKAEFSRMRMGWHERKAAVISNRLQRAPAESI